MTVGLGLGILGGAALLLRTDLADVSPARPDARRSRLALPASGWPAPMSQLRCLRRGQVAVRSWSLEMPPLGSPSRNSSSGRSISPAWRPACTRRSPPLPMWVSRRRFGLRDRQRDLSRHPCAGRARRDRERAHVPPPRANLIGAPDRLSVRLLPRAAGDRRAAIPHNRAYLSKAPAAITRACTSSVLQH